MQHLPGPNGAIAYQRDRLGYPSIQARDLAEGVYALGYLHARDRLVQVTIMALAARGQLMSLLGDVPLARLIDQSTRALGLSGDLDQQTARCDAESFRLLEAYSAGFNQGARSRPKPLVLRVLGGEPYECTPEGIFALFRFVGYFGLTSMQVSSELIIAELAARGAPERLFQRLLGKCGRGLDLDALRNVQIPPQFSFFGPASFGSKQAASNAFAVAASRSATGGALLMGEFHMEVGRFPPVLYAAHLGLSNGDHLTGITIPGLAWFAAGRTAHVGWSYTFAHADNVDFLVEHVKDGQYRAGSEYRPFRRREERVAIKGKPAETWVFHDNDYGTLFGDVAGEGDRVCVRVSGLSETHRAFSAAPRILACRSVAELVEIQREVKSLSLEAIMADRHGDVGSVVTGQIDQRPEGWSGAYPVPSARVTARVPEPVPESRRPLAIAPESGVIASANQGGHGPERESWCHFPEPGYRFQRINELLAAREIHDFDSLLRISYDVVDLSARRLLRAWRPLLPNHPLAHELVAWADDQKDRELLQLFHALHEEACFALIAEDIGRNDARRFREWSAIVFYQEQLDALLALEQPELLDEAGLRAVLDTAFFEALERAPSHSVPVRLRFRHLVTNGRSPAFFGFDSARVELPGSPVTPFQCRASPVAGETLVYAPAFHLLFDMSRPGAFYNLPGGASESRFGPGYGQGIDDWLHGTLIPLGPAPPEAPEAIRLTRD